MTNTRHSTVTDLQELADDLLGQAAGEHSRRAGRTLPHPVQGLRQTLIALQDGAALQEHESPGPATLQVLRGRVRLVAGDDVVSLRAAQSAPIPPRRHSLHADADADADADAVVLLSVALIR